MLWDLLVIGRKKLLAEPKRLGDWGERRCEKYLQHKGMTILARNYSCNAGEIDIVAADYDGCIVFAEVKTRSDETFTSAESVVTPGKMHKMHTAARYFMAEHKLHNRPCRFDVVAVNLPPKGRPQIRHYVNAFVP